MVWDADGTGRLERTVVLILSVFGNAADGLLCKVLRRNQVPTMGGKMVII